MTAFLTPAEVARVQRVHINTVYNRLAAGDYDGAQVVGRSYRIPATSIGLTNDEGREVIRESDALNEKEVA
ncbi:MAG: hypothetical protein AAF845_05645 [Bacteroidota bacterium]